MERRKRKARRVVVDILDCHQHLCANGGCRVVGVQVGVVEAVTVLDVFSVPID